MEKLKLAIIINAINPKIGGLLIQGPKGSGKTTAVRALADVLPRIRVVKDCQFNCDPADSSNLCGKCSVTSGRTGKLVKEERDMRVVNLPLGATEDRVVGSLDIEEAIKHGVEALEPGILAEANQNILYVDEINLLPDHIADDLLDAAATGWNVVEREGISLAHPSRFIFIGTMNPEEGQLRPQLLDRFPLSVSVEKIHSVDDRVEVVKRNLKFEEDPERFLEEFKAHQDKLKDQILNAREILPKVAMPDLLLEAICRASIDLKIDGMRPDIVISKAARTLTAFEGRNEVSQQDILLASEFALNHRTREGGFAEPATLEEISRTLTAKIKEVRYVEKTESAKKQGDPRKAKGKTMIWAKEEAGQKEEAAVTKRLSKLRARAFALLSRITPVFGFGKKLKRAPPDAPVSDGVTKGSRSLRGEIREEPEPESSPKVIPTVNAALSPAAVTTGSPLLTRIAATIFRPFTLFFQTKKPTRVAGYSAGKRGETVTALHRGRSRGWKLPYGKPKDIHLPATIRAAARKQKFRQETFPVAIGLSLEDVREKLRIYKAPMTIVLMIDLSGSMLLRIDEVKEALLKLHQDAYRYRDKVGIVALKDMGAVVVQHPISNLRVVASKLLKLRISGLTPLAAGMVKSLEVLKEAQRRDKSTIPVMVVITDGSANIPLATSLQTGERRLIDETKAILREYEDLAVSDVLNVAKIVRKQGVKTIVINTNPHLYGRETYGLAVTELVARTANGSHHAVGRLTRGSDLVESMMEKIAREQRLISHEVSTRKFD